MNNVPAQEPQFFAIRVCAWCDKSLPKIACHPSQHGQVTHGICEPCKEATLANFRASKSTARTAA